MSVYTVGLEGDGREQGQLHSAPDIRDDLSFPFPSLAC